MKYFDIYFSDLTEDAQKRLLKRFETTIEEENWGDDNAPLATIDREDV